MYHHPDGGSRTHFWIGVGCGVLGVDISKGTIWVGSPLWATRFTGPTMHSPVPQGEPLPAGDRARLET